ncbi:hypothetical protein GUJ93_ZPchr0013g36928 [Zizania palustris]|uniref:J domain-containing protein n=1 Tax=Zizania palustris TaxID=103762 RepID=A0A8J6C3V1_ZIZPA|nr:hypothetical protein GUJ93_ZPchr0013g36928 [Zizania palustris]KAG8098864.1 hypothetical protein GUJ93_ZPchr0013g36928 [Zizania palustris]KAG8098865.1 hypothetical protein GUJ93_ZPchr0013g36928 [Zizania palustris]KAG8098866.1 hypothetical protein GUJ93_ZPchr0013g36928 [Zizania palustris]
MARKGSQSKSDPNHASPNQQNAANGNILNTPERDVVDGENRSSHIQGGSNGSGGNCGQKTKAKKNYRNNGISSSVKSDDRASEQKSVDTNCDISNSEENELPPHTPKVRRDSKKSSRRGSGKNSSTKRTSMPVFAEFFLEKTRYIICMAVSIFRVSVMYVMEESKMFVERNRPAITTFMAIVHKGHNYVLNKFEYAYPIGQAWISNAGKLISLLLAVWLDCNIRGFNSLLHLGTNSLLAVLWCSMLSIFAMIGIKKILIFMVISAAVVAFVGPGFAILVTAVAAVVFLWLYGSFWTTSAVIFLGGASFFLKHERFTLLITCVYSMYCARSYVGWLGLLLSLNLSFISSDVLVQFLKRNVDNNRSSGSSRNSEQSSGRSGLFGEFRQSSGDNTSQSGYAQPSDRGPGDPSTSGAEKELTSEDEVSRLLNCTDHYSALGFHRYENIDVSLLKREYKKKAMLVHPDKNMGSDKAADAFKKLQNAYEILLDSLKRKTYDDELRQEELLNYFRRFQSASQKRGGSGIFRQGFSPSEDVDEGPSGLSRRIACKKCGDCHLWIYTGRAKSQARWCQDCKDFHQAKDGDGWVEQSFQPVLFGLLHKPDLPHAYVCAGSNIFDVTEWFICQGVRCLANTHKPSFHVDASLSKQNSGKGSTSAQRGGVRNGANMDGGGIDEEEFFEWLQNAVQSGMFEAFDAQSDPPSPGSGSNAKSSRKKRKGKKQQW